MLVVVLALASGRVAAQDTTPASARPYQGLFAGGNPNPNQQLELTWSLFGARDDNVTNGTRSYDPLNQVPGQYADAATKLTFSEHGDRGFFSVSGGATGRYYPDLTELSEAGGTGDVNFAINFGKKRRRTTTISVYQSAGYSPYYTLNLLNTGPSAPPTTTQPATTTGDVLTTVSSHEYDGTVRLAEAWGTQASFEMSYSYRYTQLAESPLPFLWQTGDATYKHKVSQYASLKLGYGYGQGRDGTLSGTALTTNQDIDIGIDYSRPLSRSRRTAFGFTTGSGIVTYLGVRYYRVTADANVVREIGRTWKANLTYHRGLQFVEGISVPLYADTVQTRIGGLVGKRVDMAITGGYSGGQIGLSTVGSDYVTYSGTAELHVALNRTLSLGAQYQYYRYDFDQSAVLPNGIPPVLQRQSFRVGVTGWLGLLR